MAPASGGGNPLPTPTTRSKARKAILDRILKEVIGYDDDDPMIKALDDAGIKEMPDLLSR